MIKDTTFAGKAKLSGEDTTSDLISRQAAMPEDWKIWTRVNYVKNMEAMIASVVIWVILVLVAQITTCGMIPAHLTEPAEIR